MAAACPYCGATITGRRRTHCGDVACRRRYNNDRMRRLNARHRAETGMTWAKKQKLRTERVCSLCGVAYSGRTGRTCSTLCAAISRGDRTSCLVPRGHPSRRVTPTPTRRVWASGRCERCGAWFVTQRQARFCTARCKIRDKGARRRALEAGCKITAGRRYEVFERDHWVCQICGDPVNRDVQVPELDAPVIDHRLPLAAGGTHGTDNWQTAHFYCNSVKRDTLLTAA